MNTNQKLFKITFNINRSERGIKNLKTMKKFSLLLFVCLFAQTTLNAQINVDAINDEGAVSIGPLSFKAYYNTYIIERYKIQKDESGNTALVFFGSGFGTLKMMDGRVMGTVWCDYISNGKVIENSGKIQSAAFIAFSYKSSAVPDTFILYSDENKDKKTTIKLK